MVKLKEPGEPKKPTPLQVARARLKAYRTEQGQDPSGPLFTAAERLDRDLAAAADNLKPFEARFMVDAYYTIQKERMGAASRLRSIFGSKLAIAGTQDSDDTDDDMDDVPVADASDGDDTDVAAGNGHITGSGLVVVASAEEPSLLLQWQLVQMATLENNIKNALNRYSRQSLLGRWARSNYGIGPVIAAGLLAHIRMRFTTKDENGVQVSHIMQTAGQLWSYAGLNPTAAWKKGQKRPWNARLKNLCWKIGLQWQRRYRNPKSTYGPLYYARKQIEVARNEAGWFKDVAAERLASNPPKKNTLAYAAYAQGKLPDARLDLRAMRYATKLFLAHYHHVAYEIEFGKPPPKPYVLEHMGHTNYLAPPNWPMK
jgi:hypothetical protein